MADKSFDVVTVGGGNKAVVAAMYLTKYAGLKVGMFEESMSWGPAGLLRSLPEALQAIPAPTTICSGIRALCTGTA